MNNLSIEIQDNQTAFTPGETMQGTAQWQLDDIPKSVTLNLLWYTQGKGTEDVSIVESIHFDTYAPTDQKPFSITLPNGPYSFSGKLLSIIWALELIVDKGSECHRQEITLSPTGQEITIHTSSATV